LHTHPRQFSELKSVRMVLPFLGQAQWARGNAMKLSRAVRLLAFGLLLCLLPAVLSSPSAAQIGIGVSVRVGPPALPVYEQPICPGEGYLWTPGYWAWSDDDGYYWVPGTWVEAPVGMLWTPGYWGWGDDAYLWHAGYWGPHIGFYGGINYGFGYGGDGFFGGEWRGGSFFYNTAVMRVDTVRITNVYVNHTVIVNNNSHVAFNGGEGGVRSRPTEEEERYSHESHRPAVAAQTEHEHAASRNRALFASQNHGRPAVAATARPGAFSGHGVVAAKAAGAPYHSPAMSPKQARASAPAGNHTAASHSAANRGSSPSGAKAANRPSVPPNKSNTSRTESANRASNTNRPANNTRASSTRPSTTRPSAARPSESHAAKPSTPQPSSHASNTPHTQSAARQSAPRAETAPRTTTARPSSEPRAQSAAKPSAQTRQSPPRESAPRASHSAPPPPQRQAAPPKHESAPPKEHKGR
jgi:WXXGXW repeat (2 copies)